MRTKRPTLISVAILTLATLSVAVPSLRGAASQAEPQRPPATTPFQWKRSTPEAQGVDSEMLLRSISRIRDEDLDVRSLILIRNDHVILELYVHPYSPETVHNVKSVSKSILSALVGIALREDVLKSTDQTVREFFPGYFPADGSDDRNRITLRHLLTMTSGLDLDENGPKMQAVFTSGNWIQATFEADMATAPGTRFVYSTPLTHTMVGVLTEASGMSVLEFANEHLFGPLEFGPLQWARGPQGYYFGGAELFLRTRDMAKFGLLYAHGGEWQGRQVVPADWVSESTQNQLPSGSANSYGYWWWVAPDNGGFRARGWGGQGISVQNDFRIVAAGTAGDPSATDRMFRDFDPSVLRSEPLPPNPDAVASLATLVRELEHPEPGVVPALPAVASKISGITFRIDENPRDFREFSFRFEPGSSVATVASKRGDLALEAEIGLDGVFRLTDTGAEGPMPEENQVALRGRWSADGEFIIDSHRVGDPVHATWTLGFDDDRLTAMIEIHPIDQRFPLTGTAPGLQ